MLPQKQTDTEKLFQDVKTIIESGVAEAASAVHRTALVTFWRVGRRVVEEVKGGERAAYGTETVKNLADRLVPAYGPAYSKRNLDYYCRFFRMFPDFEIVNARVHNLNWTHYRQLLGVESEDARYWYVREASRENWSARTLARNVGSQYYHRILQAPKKDAVLEEMKSLTAGGAPPVEELVKSPVIAEFFHLASNTDFTESDLEKAILDHIARYSVLNGSKQLFAAKYLTCLPSEEELRREIARQKEIFAIQHPSA